MAQALRSHLEGWCGEGIDGSEGPGVKAMVAEL